MVDIVLLLESASASAVLQKATPPVFVVSKGKFEANRNTQTAPS